jgi:hypothetical protein
VTTQCSNPQIRKAIYNNNKSSSNNNNKRSKTQRDPNSTEKKYANRNRRRSAMQISFQNCPSPLSDSKHSEEEVRKCSDRASNERENVSEEKTTTLIVCVYNNEQ